MLQVIALIVDFIVFLHELYLNNYLKHSWHTPLFKVVVLYLWLLNCNDTYRNIYHFPSSFSSSTPQEIYESIKWQSEALKNRIKSKTLNQIGSYR